MIRHNVSICSRREGVRGPGGWGVGAPGGGGDALKIHHPKGMV